MFTEILKICPNKIYNPHPENSLRVIYFLATNILHMEKIKNSIDTLLNGTNLTEEYLNSIPDLSSPDALKIITEVLKEIYNTRMPFNSFLGIRVVELSLEKAIIEITSREELYGNYIQKILHGGVISAVIDLSGGIIAQTHAFLSMNGTTVAEQIARFSKMSTLNIRVDYLRPGAGENFRCISRVLRAGNKVAVVQMELMNQDNILIAVGTGSYLIG